MMPPRPNWSRPLPRPLTIPTVMDLKTLADVRTLLGHLPKETRARDTWQVCRARTQEGRGQRRHDASLDRAADGAAA